jgi:sugar phosphate isomerase/epimerase
MTAGRPALVVPSWVTPGTYAENLDFLRDKPGVNGVELLFFMYDDDTRALFDREFSRIQAYRDRFIFTAHLPDCIKPEHEELVVKLLPLVRHFIVHPVAPADTPAEAALLLRWFARFGKEKFLIENTRFGWLENLLSLLPADTPRCMDTGHLLEAGDSPAEHFARYRPRVREIHLHAIDRPAAATDGRLVDHRPLRPGEPWLTEMLPALKAFDGVINMEVFSWEEAQKSLEVFYNE